MSVRARPPECEMYVCVMLFMKHGGCEKIGTFRFEYEVEYEYEFQVQTSHLPGTFTFLCCFPTYQEIVESRLIGL